jgi:F-type H+-transporting ATPase subunit b
LKSHVSNLSVSIAEKLLKAELTNKDSQNQLVEKMLSDAKLN